MDRITQRREYHLKLTNHDLPELAKQRNFPVRHNHCFQRIILDNLFQRCWYENLDRRQSSAYKQLTDTQLEQAIALAETIMTQPDECLYSLNQNSLHWRRKLAVQTS